MGGLIFWVIIFGVIGYRVAKKSHLQEQAPKNTGTPKRTMTDADRAKLEEYRRQKQVGEKLAAEKGDIVSRAKANSARYAKDETLGELEREHRHSERESPAGAKHTNREETKYAHTSAAEFSNPPEEESLLGSVEDLMVKGYDGNLSFERDFIGEAMDMIHSFGL